MWLWWPWKRVTQLSCFKDHAWLCTQLSSYWIQQHWHQGLNFQWAAPCRWLNRVRIVIQAILQNVGLPDESLWLEDSTSVCLLCWCLLSWETQVQSLGREDPLEEGMATHSSILAWRIPWTEEPDRLESIGSQRVGHDWIDLAWKLMRWPQLLEIQTHARSASRVHATRRSCVLSK